MFAFKKKYFLLIENTKDINLKNIKIYNKFIIIYRNNGIMENINVLKEFRKKCRLKLIEFYIANDMKLCVMLKSDGIYLSSFNKNLKASHLKNNKFKIIGSAHNFSEIIYKVKQNCTYVLFSKLFKVDYSKDSPFLNIVKFNLYMNKFNTKLIPLGGIKLSNLNKLKTASCEGLALLSEIKKKPTKIFSRLF